MICVRSILPCVHSAKMNSKRAIPLWETYRHQLERKYIETTGSLLMQRFPKAIYAVTAAGFELKIVLFLLAYSVHCLAGLQIRLQYTAAIWAFTRQAP